MAYFPDIPQVSGQTLVTTTFYGLNRSPVIADGEMEDMDNLTSDHSPVLATRARRRIPAFPGVEGGGHTTCTNPQGMMGTDKLIMIDDGVIYVDGEEYCPLRMSTDEAMQPKHMVAMGAYVCIWPDKVYINLANPDDYGPMGSKWTAGEDTAITASMCRRDGREYDLEDITISGTAPENPADQQLWIDNSSGTDVLKQWSDTYGEWTQVASTYIKIQATGIGKGLKEDDVVFLSGVKQDGAAYAGGEETLSFPSEEFTLKSYFQTTHQGGQNYVSTTATVDYRTKTIKVEGIPEGATVTGAVLKFTAGMPLFGTKVYTVNGENVRMGSNEIPVEVTGNGEYSFQFRFQGGNTATTSGQHYGSTYVHSIVLEVTYAAMAGGKDERLEALNTSNQLYGVGDDYIIVAGLLRTSVALAGTLVVERKIPDLDYVTESNNRLWGCSYAKVDGTLTNELMACALGDFRNWYRYQGTSMDSYTVSIGSDGKFTGACTVRGQPIFFKESCMHKISGTEPSSFGVTTTVCRGVQDGCWRSLAMVGEMLYYKSRMDVMAYDGSMPYAIGEKLGRTRWHEACGAAMLDKYYLCMRDDNMRWGVYVYDTIKQLWHREDDVQIHHMATVRGELYMVLEDEMPQMMCAGGSTGEEEQPFEWSVTFGKFGLTEPQQKHVSRFNIRAQLAAKASMTLYIQYDSDGVWHHMGTMKTPILRTFLLPVAPRRCDHLQVMLKGYGDAKIYSISREYQEGGDGGYGKISRSANA